MKLILLTLCLLAISQSCVQRADVISKAMEWVRDKVPYSQTGSHQGYRTDCSGYASCAWRLSKPGLTTGQFVPQGICSQTSKDHLEKGDFMLNPSHHVVIFDGWVDGAKTTYWAMQEEGTAYGTVRRQVRYPYGSMTGFFPCKVKIACASEEQNLQIQQ